MNKFGTRLRADETPKNAQGSVSPSRFPPLRFSLRPLASEPAVGATRDLRVARSAGGLRGRRCPAPCAPAPRLAPALRRSALTRAKGLTQGRPDPPPPLRTARCGPQAGTAPAQRFGPGAKPLHAAVVAGKVSSRVGRVSRAEALDSRMSRAGQTLRWKSGLASQVRDSPNEARQSGRWRPGPAASVDYSAAT